MWPCLHNSRAFNGRLFTRQTVHDSNMRLCSPTTSPLHSPLAGTWPGCLPTVALQPRCPVASPSCGWPFVHAAGSMLETRNRSRVSPSPSRGLAAITPRPCLVAPWPCGLAVLPQPQPHSAPASPLPCCSSPPCPWQPSHPRNGDSSHVLLPCPKLPASVVTDLAAFSHAHTRCAVVPRWAAQHHRLRSSLHAYIFNIFLKKIVTD